MGNYEPMGGSLNIRELLAKGTTGLSGMDRASVREVVAQKMANLIASGAIAVGDILPSERDLAAAMSVSRETIRGAILILSTHGVLQVTQGARTTVVSDDVGHFVKDVARIRTVADYKLQEVHEARLFVEEQVVRAAASRIDTATLDLLRRMIRSQEAAVSDPVRFLISDREFHTAIYRSGGNAPLADVATDLYAYLLDQRRTIITQPGRIASSIEEHKVILSGLETRDPDAAAAAFADHETQIYTTTQQLISGSPEPAVNKPDRQ